MSEVCSTYELDAAQAERAAGGDVKAYEALVERYYGSVYAIAYSVLGQRETAEDLAQEVFLRCLLNLDKLRHSRAFAAWALRIARNLSFDWRKTGQRASKLVQFVGLEAEDPALASRQPLVRETLERQERQEALAAAVMRLSSSQRETVLLHFAQGLTLSETARQLGVRPSTVTRRLERALRGLRQQLRSESAPGTRLQPLQASEGGRKRALAFIGLVALLPAAQRTALAQSVTLPNGSASPLLPLLPIHTPGGKIAMLLTLVALAGIAFHPVVVRGPEHSRQTAADTSRLGRTTVVAAVTRTPDTGISGGRDRARARKPPRNSMSQRAGGAANPIVSDAVSSGTERSAWAAASPEAGQTTPSVSSAAAAARTTSAKAQPTIQADTAVDGTVTTEDGVAVPYLDVRLRFAQPNNVSLKLASTASDGSFKFAGIPAGRAELWVLDLNYVPLILPIEVPAHGVQVKVSTEGGVVEGKVVDEQGQPVAGADVRWGYLEFDSSLAPRILPGVGSISVQPTWNFIVRLPVVTDQQGCFRLEKVPTWMIGVTAKLGSRHFAPREMGHPTDVISQVSTPEEWTKGGYFRLKEKETTSGIVLEPAVIRTGPPRQTPPTEPGK